MTDLPDLMRRVRAMADDAPALREQRRQRNRAEMPLTAAEIDEWTRVFGRLPAGRVQEGAKFARWGDQSLFGLPGAPVSLPPRLRGREGRQRR